MIRAILNGGFTTDLLIELMATTFVVFCVLPLHEYAHAWMANRLGDDTARLAGRLTINPLKHLDLFGAILIFIAGFGYAKPVPVNPLKFKDSKKGMALTAAAGPAMNLILAFFFLLLSYIAALFADPVEPYAVAGVAMSFFSYAAVVNISLAVFNLLPIPPLDGSRIATLFLPRDLYFKIMQYERYMIYILYALLIFGGLDSLLSFFVGLIYNGMDFLISLPFRLF